MPKSISHAFNLPPNSIHGEDRWLPVLQGRAVHEFKRIDKITLISTHETYWINRVDLHISCEIDGTKSIRMFWRFDEVDQLVTCKFDRRHSSLFSFDIQLANSPIHSSKFDVGSIEDEDVFRLYCNQISVLDVEIR